MMQGLWTSRLCRTPSNLPGGSASAGSPPFWFVSMITFCGCPTVRSVAVGRAVLSSTYGKRLTDYGPIRENDRDERGNYVNPLKG
jgi:hypothetical protein